MNWRNWAIVVTILGILETVQIVFFGKRLQQLQAQVAPAAPDLKGLQAADQAHFQVGQAIAAEKGRLDAAAAAPTPDPLLDETNKLLGGTP